MKRLTVISISILHLPSYALNVPGNVYATTECKSCPYSLCTSVKILNPEESPNTTFTCWTSGTEIYNETTWLKTVDNCYLSEYDVEEAPDATELPYCGFVKEPEWPKRNGRTRYFSECYRMPWFADFATKYYRNNVDLDLLCSTKNVTGYFHEVMEKPGTWYKTNSNCFVHETTLWPTEDDLEDCGPLDTELPLRESPETEEPPPESSTTSTTTPAPTGPAAATTWRTLSRHSLHRRFLYNTTIGEEYVNCTFSSNSTDRAHGIKRVYEFDQLIYPQCGTIDNDVIMLFTTDFCWIKDDECWIQLTDSTLRSEHFPKCERFVDTVS